MIHGNEVRTPNPSCPACQLGRYHNEEEWKKYHPLAGTGIQADTTYITKKETAKL